MAEVALWRRLVAEFAGSAFLAAVVIGAGIAAVRLSPGATGLELLEDAAATAAGLFAIILMFGPVSGGHFNPVVSFADAALGGLRWRDAAAYLPAQVAGCITGAVAANVMFGLAAVSVSVKSRATPEHFLSEIIATLGLLLVIFALVRSGRAGAAPAAVGAYIGAAYFFISSTSFANPAITVGRMFSDTFAGIAPASAPAFIAGQVIGGTVAVLLVKALYPHPAADEATSVLVSHATDALPGAGQVHQPSFDHAVARTGLRDHEATSAGFDPVTITAEADDHKAYYPGSHRIRMRVTGDQNTGRLLGMQLFGHKHAEIAKRIDIAATVIYHGMIVDDVSDLDLSYTPPLGSPWEAVQMGTQAWAREVGGE